ncbi:DNA-binding transcriptional regulator, IclR family [Salinihabitans flavidus]|uniref:DNA-binding transcriptional regulator, IclR family n=1 Tax=Salinihabitans flavidus TaxID=569882 RepID=A0A1H8U6M4_9RHOB|nr:IclR family transcriptional regulator [Salinihabitans flavidus]SEO98503.1 DNA-binding transcriptional regulator, IclR family [Salinihabitans flavidus]
MDKTCAPDPDSDRYLVPGLMRGLAILDAFTPERREMSLSDIARTLGLSRSAAFRAVYTLAQMGYLLHDERARTYALGPAVMRLGYGYLATRELVEVALPELEALRNDTDWSAHLGVRDGTRVLYMLRVPSRMGLGSIVHVGSRLPAAGTTMGRVLLADLDEDTMRALYRDEIGAPGAGRGPRDMAELLRQWQRDREAGTVVQIGSFETGMASVAAPVRDMSGGVIAAVSATRAYTDAEEVTPDLRARVRDCASRISGMLGART